MDEIIVTNEHGLIIELTEQLMLIKNLHKYVQKLWIRDYGKISPQELRLQMISFRLDALVCWVEFFDAFKVENNSIEVFGKSAKRKEIGSIGSILISELKEQSAYSIERWICTRLENFKAFRWPNAIRKALVEGGGDA